MSTTEDLLPMVPIVQRENRKNLPYDEQLLLMAQEKKEFMYKDAQYINSSPRVYLEKLMREGKITNPSRGIYRVVEK